VHWDRSSIALIRWLWISNKERPFLISEIHQARRVYTNAAKFYFGGHSFPFTVKTIITPHSTVNNLFNSYIKIQPPIKFTVQKICMEQNLRTHVCDGRAIAAISTLINTRVEIMRYFVFVSPPPPPKKNFNEFAQSLNVFVQRPGHVKNQMEAYDVNEQGDCSNEKHKHSHHRLNSNPQYYGHWYRWTRRLSAQLLDAGVGERLHRHSV
jgi:hypothetical protein